MTTLKPTGILDRVHFRLTRYLCGGSLTSLGKAFNHMVVLEGMRFSCPWEPAPAQTLWSEGDRDTRL